MIQKKSCTNKLISIICITILIISLLSDLVYAIEVADGAKEAPKTTCIIPNDNQYLELKATEVKSTSETKSQVIMELWGYNIESSRI